MHFDKVLSQRQTKAGPFILAVELAVDLLERSQRCWNVLKLDPDPCLDYLENVATVRTTPSPQRDLTAGIREFDRVGKQVDQDLLQLPKIDP